MSDLEAQYLRLLEAVLFASAEPISEKHLADRLPGDADLPALLTKLQGDYAERGVNVVRAGKSWAIRTAPDLAAKLTAPKVISRRLSRAAVETLAIIAYHQPVTRGEIEEIRGVAMSRGTLDVLLEEGWVRPRGRRQTPGRPTTWGTTDAFLDHFGLESLGDLPGVEDLKAAGLLDSGPAVDSFRGNPALAPDGVDAVEEPGEEAPEPLDPGDSLEPDVSPG